MPITIIFFGSFGHYSALVLEKLISAQNLQVTRVVTSPAFTNRKGQIEKSPVEVLALQNNIPVTTTMPSKFAEIDSNFEADFLITAGYGQLLPNSLLAEPKVAALNLHFSVLPKYRGANPGEWAILMNEKESGISVIEMNEKFDQGGVLFTASTQISSLETRESLYEKLYTLGGEHLPKVIEQVNEGSLKPSPQPNTDLPYASRFKREDGFINWSAILELMSGQKSKLDFASDKLKQIAELQKMDALNSAYIERACRALQSFPSLWTIVSTNKGEKRMKLHKSHLDGDKLVLDEVQIEGQTVSLWNQVKNQVI